MQILEELRKVIRYFQRSVDQFVLFVFGLADNMRNSYSLFQERLYDLLYEKVFFRSVETPHEYRRLSMYLNSIYDISNCMLSWMFFTKPVLHLRGIQNFIFYLRKDFILLYSTKVRQ